MCVLHVRCVCMLAGNQIGAAGAERLAAALEKNSSLTQLNLSCEWHGMRERQEMAWALSACGEVMVCGVCCGMMSACACVCVSGCCSGLREGGREVAVCAGQRTARMLMLFGDVCVACALCVHAGRQ